MEIAVSKLKTANCKSGLEGERIPSPISRAVKGKFPPFTYFPGVGHTKRDTVTVTRGSHAICCHFWYGLGIKLGVKYQKLLCQIHLLIHEWMAVGQILLYRPETYQWLYLCGPLGEMNKCRPNEWMVVTLAIALPLIRHKSQVKSVSAGRLCFTYPKLIICASWKDLDTGTLFMFLICLHQ